PSRWPCQTPRPAPGSTQSPERRGRTHDLKYRRRVAINQSTNQSAIINQQSAISHDGNAVASTCSSVSTGTNRIVSLTSGVTSARSGSLRAGRTNVLLPKRRAASAFSRIPPTGSTRPLSVISPVIATSSLTVWFFNAETIAVAIVTPADG